jgi:DinB family protein
MASAGTSKPRLEELRDYCEQIENIKEDATELTATLSDEQFNWRPRPKRWSISECLAHLNLTDGIALPEIAAAIEQARKAGMTAPGPFRYSLFSRTFIRYVEPPPKVRVKVPKGYEPPAGHSKDQVVPEFVALHDRWLELIAQADGLDLARIKVGIPVRRVKFSLGQRFALLTAHDRRHLWQAWEVRRHREFPLG